MLWVTPSYSKKEINDAGKVLLDKASSASNRNHALTVINNFRSSHSFPLNTFQIGLRRKARQVDSTSIIAQRIKRLSSIEAKLKRFNTMKLSQMQDLGGCRSIVSSVHQVFKLLEAYTLRSNLKHTLEDVDNYIVAPKPSGYRGIHLKYSYFSDKNETFNGLKIEIQLRSQIQHAWATAVETVGTFINQALKSSLGEKEWLRFFALMSSALAHIEQTALVPGTPEDKAELVKELRKYVEKLDVKNKLITYGEALKTTLENTESESVHYFLLKLDTKTKEITVTGYKSKQLERASEEYLDLEREASSTDGIDAVLVSVESIAALERAYPNYFLDTKAFVGLVDKALEI